MLRQCIQRVKSVGGGGGGGRRRLHYYSHLHRPTSLLSTQSYNDDNTNNTTTNITNHHHQLLLLSTSFNNKHNPSSTLVTKRYFSISRYTDPLTKHGTINKLDDDHDDHAAAVVLDDGNGGTKPVLYTADDLEYEDLIQGGDNGGLGLGLTSSSDVTTPLSEFWADELEDASSDVVGGGGRKGGGSDDYTNLFGTFGTDDDDNNNEDDEELDEQAKADEAYRLKQEAINAELDKRTGRLWTDDWIITDEEWMTDELYDDIEEWKVNVYTTRKALESVRVYNNNNEEEGSSTIIIDGVPTLQSLSKLIVPPTLPSHPGHGTPIKYATYRKRQLKKKLQTSIQLAIHDDILKILNMESWDEKQLAVDALYETIGERMRHREDVLCKLPNFDSMVEEGLEKVLSLVQSNLMRDGRRKQREVDNNDATTAAIAADNDEILPSLGDADADADADGSSNKMKNMKVQDEEGKGETNNVEEIIDVMDVNKETPTPIFMDILAAANSLKQQQSTTPSTTSSSADNDDGDDSNVESIKKTPTTTPKSISKFFTESNNDDVPNLLHPLTVHHNDGVGRMVEEWQLAAHKETKRIMIRDSMVDIASKIVNSTHCCEENVDEERKGAARIFVSGKRGVGKTAALAGIVASARISGHIVVYHPDGDRLRKHGYYMDPCNHREGLYNLPMIAKEFCQELLTSHGDDIANLPISVSREDMKDFLTDDQIRRVFKRAYADDETVSEEDTTNMSELSLNQVLTVGTGSNSLASGCYCAVIDKLMNQTLKPFTVVMDEFNCYYDHGHYFHMEYDEHVRKGVPLNRITIFKPFMDAMGLYPNEAGTDITDKFAVDSKKALMKWGSIIVGTSECRAVKRSITQSLEECAQKAQPSSVNSDDEGVHVVEVRRLTNVEVQHQLYNYEIIGIGKLRFDRGDTSLNPEEVEYLRLVSGGQGQQLMDAVMMP